MFVDWHMIASAGHFNSDDSKIIKFSLSSDRRPFSIAVAALESIEK
jgi:hypothetical protein